MVVNDTKIYLKMKIISLPSKEKNIIKWEKAPYYNYKNVILKSNDLKSSFEKAVLKLQI